ncbi:hypothetical protein P152DRAFT_452742 [Eremomyces bilateralis CBS 781.70]|uniref:Methyltransferase domain-containing protein n=1 Tax=Eremomyces bilateralis CBS 781.70 TaxID=1392243 RepID=A0A6G1FSG9_9PEZI|nr:uncharacterized protein P152DRAFT_452742 [Eremomyces bilateralis CBS 781.70]KAF1808658.1 hypothetical protein P152DRAFT_452742 [Eremomyces bilateralis CBS 781.70]
MGSSEESRDFWTSKQYATSAAFVPQLTQKVVQYLAVEENDRILDLGCGDGILTAQIASALKSGYILGLDASPSMIQSAQHAYPTLTHPRCEFRVKDCTQLIEGPSRDGAIDGTWDKVFSNAALHWILRSPSTRLSVLEAAYRALKPGGTFVFEMGGAGNVSEIHAALTAGLLHFGCPLETARAASPWFFPSDAWMKNALEGVGFTVDKVELEYRPTKLTEAQNGGLEGWVKLFGASVLDHVEESKRDECVGWVSALLQTIVTREEDGSQWLGYVRLRGVATKGA